MKIMKFLSLLLLIVPCGFVAASEKKKPAVAGFGTPVFEQEIVGLGVNPFRTAENVVIQSVTQPAAETINADSKTETVTKGVDKSTILTTNDKRTPVVVKTTTTTTTTTTTGFLGGMSTGAVVGITAGVAGAAGVGAYYVSPAFRKQVGEVIGKGKEKLEAFKQSSTITKLSLTAPVVVALLGGAGYKFGLFGKLFSSSDFGKDRSDAEVIKTK